MTLAARIARGMGWTKCVDDECWVGDGGEYWHKQTPEGYMLHRPMILTLDWLLIDPTGPYQSVLRPRGCSVSCTVRADGRAICVIYPPNPSPELAALAAKDAASLVDAVGEAMAQALEAGEAK